MLLDNEKKTRLEELLIPEKTVKKLKNSASLVFTIANGGKPWKYVLLSHDKVDRTSSFDFMIHY